MILDTIVGWVDVWTDVILEAWAAWSYWCLFFAVLVAGVIISTVAHS